MEGRQKLSDKQKIRLFSDLGRLMEKRAALTAPIGGVHPARAADPVNSNYSASPKPRVVRGHISLTKSSMRTDPRPIDPTCECYTCSGRFFSCLSTNCMIMLRLLVCQAIKEDFPGLIYITFLNPKENVRLLDH